MKLFHQLILFILAATTIPLLIGFMILRHNEQTLQGRLLGEREESAARVAEAASREIQEVFDRVKRVLDSAQIPWEEVTEQDAVGILRIAYRQSENIVQVGLVDGDGKPKLRGVYLERPQEFPEFATRVSVSGEDHARFLRDLAVANARDLPKNEVYAAPPHLLAKSGLIAFSFLVPLELPAVKTRWFAAVEVSLQQPARRVAEFGDSRGWSALLVDGKGRAIAESSSPVGSAPLRDLSSLPAVMRLLAGGLRGAFFEQDALVAFARVPRMDYGVVLSQAKNDALAEVRRARRLTVAWTGVSILALLLLGGLYTGRITRNLRRFAEGAQQFSRGNLDARIELKARDELGFLAQTFNQMGEDLKVSREEIELWNRELAQRVEERTRDLELAHRRLLETSKLAAIGQLGAGVAHEINNPLVGILGNVQLLLMKGASIPGEDLDVLKKMEAAARRCKDVIQNLQRFSEQEENPEHLDCDLRAVLNDAYSLTEQRIKSQGIQTIWAVPEKLPAILGDHRQLIQIFLNLFSNARIAMPKGGTLKISVKCPWGAFIEILVSDTGKGIPPEHLARIFEPFFTTKDEWTNTGLGLSVVYRIVSDHGGRIEVESQPGKGSTFRVKLPTFEEGK